MVGNRLLKIQLYQQWLWNSNYQVKELFENLEKTESTPPEEIKVGGGTVFFITEDGQKTCWDINGEGVWWQEKYYSVKEEDVDSLCDSLREIFGEE